MHAHHPPAVVTGCGRFPRPGRPWSRRRTETCFCWPGKKMCPVGNLRSGAGHMQGMEPNDAGPAARPWPRTWNLGGQKRSRHPIGPRGRAGDSCHRPSGCAFRAEFVDSRRNQMLRMPSLRSVVIIDGIQRRNRACRIIGVNIHLVETIRRQARRDPGLPKCRRCPSQSTICLIHPGIRDSKPRSNTRTSPSRWVSKASRDHTSGTSRGGLRSPIRRSNRARGNPTPDRRGPRSRSRRTRSQPPRRMPLRTRSTRPYPGPAPRPERGGRPCARPPGDAGAGR